MKRILLVLLSVTILVGCTKEEQQPKYIFYFIGDGMAHNHIALTEAWLASTTRSDSAGFAALNFTQFPAVGFATSNCSNRRITDSAAAGTALASGEKTSAGTIGMNSDWTENLYSTAITAQKAGMATGVITSVSIDHATPASFYAYQKSRDMYHEIGLDAAKTGLDLYGGSGFVREHPEGKTSILDTLAQVGYTIIRGNQPVTGNRAVIMQEESYAVDALPLAIDRTEKDLTLAQMTQRSIDFLTELNDKQGFFLMVEGGQIDWAAHDNDPGGLVHETLDFAAAIQVALDFYQAHPDETLIVVTADHETGGVSLGRSERGYDSDFHLLSEQKCSKKVLIEKMKQTTSWEEAETVLKEMLGFGTTIHPNEHEWETIKTTYKKNPGGAANPAIQVLSKNAGVGWTSGSHTAAYVPVFAIGSQSALFNGRADNTDIPLKIKSLIEKK